MNNHECTQEPTISRIDKKIDVIDEKLDKYLEKTIQTETRVGFITTGFIILIAPVIVGVILFFIKG
jgi:hypothetical protein